MPDLFEAVGVLVRVRCWCGIQHAVPSSLREEQLRQFNDGRTPESIYCPLGHQHRPVGLTEVKKLQHRLHQQLAAYDQVKAELRNTENSRRAEKAAKTRLKNRIANGVCPCCHRTFANLARHMGKQHPKYTDA